MCFFQETYLDLVGSGDNLAAGDDPEVSIVAVKETAEEKQGKEDTENLTDPLNTYLQVRLTYWPFDIQTCRLATGSRSGTLPMRPGTSITLTQVLAKIEMGVNPHNI